MNEKLYIPKKLNVGFQLRSDTYTGRLGYIIYWDDKGKLRKENSWQSWRHKPDQEKSRFYNHAKRCYESNGELYGDAVTPLILDNLPIEGFVLNKDVGGVRSSWGWNDRLEKVRVFDPRGFEFEISIPNLLFILQECSSIKGKGLEGNFVYSWSGTELVLLPVGSQEYKKSAEFTELQGKDFKIKDCEKGFDYIGKDKNVYCYLGRDLFCNVNWSYPSVTMEHIFWDYKNKKFVNKPKLSEKGGESTSYADLCETLSKTDHCVAIKEIKFLDRIMRTQSKNYYNSYCFKYSNDVGLTLIDNIYQLYTKEWKDGFKLEKVFSIKNGGMSIIPNSKFEKFPDFDSVEFYNAVMILENGTEIPLNGGKEINEINKRNKV